MLKTHIYKIVFNAQLLITGALENTLPEGIKISDIIDFNDELDKDWDNRTKTKTDAMIQRAIDARRNPLKKPTH